MSITVSVVDLISWVITFVSIVLFILERRKNEPFYMTAQGILRACKAKAGYYGSLRIQAKTRKNISTEEYNLLVEGAYSDFTVLMETTMGLLKAIEPKKDQPFDAMDFTRTKNKNHSEENQAD